MRLSWFTPLPSDDDEPELPESLGPYLRHLLPTLANRVDLTVFTKQQRWSTWIDELVTVKPITASDSFWSEVHQGDLCVYHLADRPYTFAQFFDLSRTQPGLVVLHDRSIHSLVATIWARFRDQPQTYLEILRRYAGEESVEAGRRWLADGLAEDQKPEGVSLLDYLLESALAGITHSPSFRPRLSSADPIHTLPLPFVPSVPPRPIETEEPGDERRLVIFTEPERSVYPVLEALVLHPVVSQLRLTLSIFEEQRASIVDALRELRLSERTVLFSEASDPELEEHVRRAHLVVDYRRGAEQEFLYRLYGLQQLGAPVAAPLDPEHPFCRQGWVLGIRASRVIEDFRRHLNLLHGSPDSLRELGVRAERRLREHHRPEAYVNALLDIVDEAADRQTQAACRRFAHRMSARLSWLPEGGRAPLFAPIAELLSDLSAQEPPPQRRRSRTVTRDGDSRSLPDAGRLAELRDALAEERRARKRADARLAGLESRLDDLAAGRDPGRDSSTAAGLDRYYLEFENRFRGTPEEIKKRLEVYGPQILETAARFPDEPCVDLGCGRGEWLEILGSHGLRALGVDANRSMVEACREKGLDAQLEDGLGFVGRQADDSVALLTGFHIIEHLPGFESLAELVDEARRVLLPGGLLILESPNPENLTVGACSFYLDHTHQKPLHPESVALLLRAAGFTDVKALRLVHGRALEPPFEIPEPDSRLTEDLGRVMRLLNNYLLSAPDFAVVGRKPDLDE